MHIIAIVLLGGIAIWQTWRAENWKETVDLYRGSLLALVWNLNENGIKTEFEERADGVSVQLTVPVKSEEGEDGETDA